MRLVVAFLVIVATAGLSFSLLLQLQPEQVVYLGANPVSALEEDGGDIGIEGIQVVSHLRSEVVVSEFSIQIPRIGVNKQVEANTDPARRSVYMPVLDRAVAHGKYTLLPFQATTQGNVYLFAHREGPSGFFNRLGELKQGDTITLRFNGSVYTYSVSHSFVVNPEDTEVYTGESPTPTLTLQTCENGTAQRLIVKADLLGVQKG